jgi:hypothetical protein
LDFIAVNKKFAAQAAVDTDRGDRRQMNENGTDIRAAHNAVPRRDSESQKVGGFHCL